MRIKVNEQWLDIADGETLQAIRQRVLPQADVLVYNGAPISDDVVLHDGDQVVLIQRGVIPSRDELEALMMARHTPGVHDVVRKKTVGIAGLGGLGSAIAIALVRVGIGRLILADFDVVEPSNLNRQQYYVDQIGQFKADALRENLLRINPCMKLETHQTRLTAENVPFIYSAADVMVEAFDTPDAKAMLLDTWTNTFPDQPLVMASGVAGYEPNNTIRTRQIGRQVIVVGDGQSEAKPGMGLMAPRVGIAAHQQANAVLRLLLNLPVIE